MIQIPELKDVEFYLKHKAELKRIDRRLYIATRNGKLKKTYKATKQFQKYFPISKTMKSERYIYLSDYCFELLLKKGFYLEERHIVFDDYGFKYFKLKYGGYILLGSPYLLINLLLTIIDDNNVDDDE